MFGNNFNFVGASWNTAYGGSFTGGTLSANNTTHTLNFNLVFTLPSNYSASILSTNPGWFYNFSVSVYGKNNYSSSISADSNGVTNFNGTGQAQFQNVALAAGASSSNIIVYFYGGTWGVPAYNVNGNSYSVNLMPSYVNIGRSVTYSPWYVTERYYINATVTLILPPAATPTPSPTPTPTPTPEPTPTPTPEPTPTPTPEPTPTPTPEPTATPTPTPTPTVTDTPTPTPTDTTVPG